MPAATHPALRNRMSEATSPYLLQHAHNPVHWQPWGDEAFAAAEARGVPVLLSVGYAACHWCHVMAHESFEDEAIAARLNAQFVCIKVDREERPDVDAVYMAVTQALNQGRGGWPMTVVMTPHKEPFFAGTYFPPRANRGMPGFADIIEHIVQLWQDDQTQLLDMASSITAAVTQSPEPEAHQLPSAAQVQDWRNKAGHKLVERFDPQWGGFTAAPKFPHTETLRFLLHTQHHTEGFASMVRHTLDTMARGGLYDVVGGGFSRYSVDAAWHVPHFEKMLYDNALLAATYAEAFMALHEPQDARVLRATLNFVLRELQSPQGTFYASLDADSEGHEGRFYSWHRADAREALDGILVPPDIESVLDILGLSEGGNWEQGTSIPRLENLAQGEDALVQAACQRLLQARAERVRPATDTKILTGHNGLMLSALALGCRALSAPHYLEHGCRTANALWDSVMGADGVLMRMPTAGGGPKVVGMLEDYAYLAEGLLDLYEAGAPNVHLSRAITLCHSLLQEFADARSGALYQTGPSHEKLLFRPLESHDGATPSAYATAAHVLLRAARHTGEAGLQDAAEAALGAMAVSVKAMPQGHCRALTALAFAHSPSSEAVFVSDRAPWDEGQNAQLFGALAQAYAPHRIIAHNYGLQLGQSRPLLLHRGPLEGRPTIYLCQNHTCQAPLSDVHSLRNAQGNRPQ